MQNENIPYHSLVSQLGAFCHFLFKLPDLLSVGIPLALQGHCKMTKFLSKSSSP